MLMDTFIFFFFNDTATTEIYTLSLHDALPIWTIVSFAWEFGDSTTGSGQTATHTYAVPGVYAANLTVVDNQTDRKSTRLNSSHSQISYAVFCLKKKKRSSKIKHTQAHNSNHLV